MPTLTPPKSNIPIGWLTLTDGKKLSVSVDPEWLRYLSQDLFYRAGGPTGDSTSDLSLSQFEDAGVSENYAEFIVSRDGADQSPAWLMERVAELEAAQNSQAVPSDLLERITALEADIKALQQGLSA